MHDHFSKPTSAELKYINTAAIPSEMALWIPQPHTLENDSDEGRYPFLARGTKLMNDLLFFQRVAADVIVLRTQEKLRLGMILFINLRLAILIWFPNK